MKKKELTIDNLEKAALEFCKLNSGVYKPELFGVTDGKAIGTYVEHQLLSFLDQRFNIEKGNSASGLDLPSINTDIKVTSIKQPQSSCPFKDSKQKIFGLGYNLIVFVYKKHDNTETQQGMLDFVSCCFIDKSRTGDYQMTTGLRAIISNNGNRDDVFAFLIDHHIPADEPTLYRMADEILHNPPMIGYLTISNALQWRLQYGRVVALENEVEGINTLIKLKG
ncbi:MAG: restriction endonuclease [Muribaculaceae bacterium]|nr:restriction endonuclease [Muribaculaceae bacterium]